MLTIWNSFKELSLWFDNHEKLQIQDEKIVAGIDYAKTSHESEMDLRVAVHN